MKISKFAAIVKKKCYCAVIHTPDELYLSTGVSIYRAGQLPDMTGKEQVGAVLDIEPSKMEKVMLAEQYSESSSELFGLDLSDGMAAGEMEAKRMKLAAVLDGYSYVAFRCDDGELIFFDESLLAPLSDKINDKETGMYISYAVRLHENGMHYIVVKDGFTTLGAIMPVTVLSDEYISDLKDFQAMCITQLEREKVRVEKCAAKKEAGMQQGTLDGLEDDGENGEEE